MEYTLDDFTYKLKRTEYADGTVELVVTETNTVTSEESYILPEGRVAPKKYENQPTPPGVNFPNYVFNSLQEARQATKDRIKYLKKTIIVNVQEQEIIKAELE